MWLAAARWPPEVVPPFTSTTGFARATAARRSNSARPSATPSTYARLTAVASSSRVPVEVVGDADRRGISRTHRAAHAHAGLRRPVLERRHEVARLARDRDPARRRVWARRSACARWSTGRVPHQRGIRRGGRRGPPRRAELVALADELGILLAGPNGQGRRVDARRACARRSSRPYPPPGRIAIASQSGNFVSSFENWATQTGVGVSRAVSAGNAAAVGIADYLDWYARRRRDRGEPRVRRRRRRRPRAVRTAGRASRARSRSCS